MKRAAWPLLLAAILLAPVTAQEKKDDKPVFVTVDKNNVPVFSDNPVPGASQLQLKEGNRMPAVTPSEIGQRSIDHAPKYEVTITKPEHEGTVRENNGSVYVSGQVKPLFAQGLRVRLYLNGQAVAGPSSNANFILHNIDRGEHQLMLELSDQNGKVIATSSVTTFFLHRASAITPK
jgi:hypothetical protein